MEKLVEREVDFGLRLTLPAASHVAREAQFKGSTRRTLLQNRPVSRLHRFRHIFPVCELRAMMDWDPSRFFRVSEASSPYALLVLNQPINERAFGVLSEHGGFPNLDGCVDQDGDVIQHCANRMQLPISFVLMVARIGCTI